jgi:endonuclease G, mitochondrial
MKTLQFAKYVHHCTTFLTNMSKITYKPYWTLIVLLILFVSGCTQPQINGSDVHLTLGNPTNATHDNHNSDNYLIQKAQYSLSYNNSKKIANWVSWQLNKNWLGTVDRQNNFQPDKSLPTEWYHVKPSDYSGSGYDKGHLTPSADRTKNVEDNSATFLMTNMIPQAPENNRVVWADLEEYSRELVKKDGKELYIIAGGLGQIGAIGKKEKITIPAKTWKIIVILDKPGLGLKGISKDTKVIAVEIPNNDSIKGKKWTDFRVNVKQIEKDTGYNFLSNVSGDIQKVIENKI